MKFTCRKRDLKRLLDSIASIATKTMQDKPLILITSSVKRQAVQFRVTNPLVRGSGILSEEMIVEADGKTCINARVFSDIVASIQYSSDSEVCIWINEDGMLELKSGNDYQYMIGTLSPIVFPYIDDKKPDNIVTIRCEDFRRMVQATSYAANRQYPHMQISFGNNMMKAISTDTAQLPVYGIEIDSDIQGKIVVSAEAMFILRRHANGSTMKFAWSDEEVICKFDDYVFRARAFSAPFPAWEALLNMTDNNPRVASVDATDFRHIMSSATTFGASIGFKFSRDKLFISANSEAMGRGRWELDCNYKGDDVSLMFGSRVLGEYARLIKGGELEFKFDVKNRPVLVTWSLNDNYKYIIMPVVLGE